MPTQGSRHDRENGVISCVEGISQVQELTVKSRSLKTLKRAVSVLWCNLKLDWNFSEVPFMSSYDCSWSEATFSKTCTRKGGLEIGLTLDKNRRVKIGLFDVGLCMFEGGWNTARHRWTINQANNRWHGPGVLNTSLRDGRMSQSLSYPGISLYYTDRTYSLFCSLTSLDHCSVKRTVWALLKNWAGDGLYKLI